MLRRLLAAVLFLLFQLAPAASFEVTGTVTVRVTHEEKKGDIASGEEEVRRFGFTVTYTFDQGRHGVARSQPPAEILGYEDHYHHHKKLACKYESKMGRDESTSRFSGRHETWSPGKLRFPADRTLGTESSSDLTAVIELPTVPGFPPVEHVSDMFCPESGVEPHTWTTEGNFSFPTIRITWPRKLMEPHEETITLARSFSINDPAIDVCCRGPDYFEGTVDVDLKISRMPVAKTAVSALSPLRGAVVTFDATKSLGDFDTAFWLIKFNKEACEKPLAWLASRGPAQSVPVIDAMKNPLHGLQFDGWPMPAREPDMADRLVRTTPALCPFTAQLVLWEDVLVRSFGDTVSIEPAARDWGAVFTHEGPRENQPDQISEWKNGQWTTRSLTDLLNGLGHAINVLSLCVSGTTINLDGEACNRAYDLPGLFPPEARDITFLGVPDENGRMGIPAEIARQMGLTIQSFGEDGPFSGYYFLRSQPDSLFKDVTVLDPYFYTQEFRAENAQFSPLPGWEEKLFGYLKLHEFMHTFFRNKVFEEARRKNLASGVNDYRPGASKAYDPAVVIEQMFDTDPSTLLQRAILVVIDASRKSEPTEISDDGLGHFRMHEWQKWVGPNDTYEGRNLRNEILKYDRAIPFIKRGELKQTGTSFLRPD